MTSMFDEKQKMFLEYLISSNELFVKTRAVFEAKYFEQPLQPCVEFVNKYFREYHAPPSADIIRVETGIDLTAREVGNDQFDFISKEFERFAQDQAMRLAFYDSMDDINKSDLSPIFKRISEVYTVCIDKDLGTDIYRDPAIRLSKMEENIDSRSIGWRKLDQVMDMVRRGELILFAAGSGGGKSVVLANIAKNHSAQGLHGVYFSLELKEELVSKRMDAMITGIAIKEIFDNVDTVVEHYRQAQESHGSIIIKKIPQHSTATDIRTYLMEYQLQYGRTPDFICVDYLDLMRPNDKMDTTNAFERDKAVSEELRSIFEDYNVYGYTASQLNRDAVGTTQKSQAHIAGGISKINTADAVISLSRTDEQKDRGEIEFQPLKLRNASFTSEPIILYWNSENLRITDDVQTKRVVNIKDKLTTEGAKKDDSDPARDMATSMQSINQLKDIVGMSNRI